MNTDNSRISVAKGAVENALASLRLSHQLALEAQGKVDLFGKEAQDLLANGQLAEAGALLDAAMDAADGITSEFGKAAGPRNEAERSLMWALGILGSLEAEDKAGFSFPG